MLPINHIELFCFLKTYSFYKYQTEVEQVMSAYEGKVASLSEAPRYLNSLHPVWFLHAQHNSIYAKYEFIFYPKKWGTFVQRTQAVQEEYEVWRKYRLPKHTSMIEVGKLIWSEQQQSRKSDKPFHK